jgi:hypothetical protein
VLLHRLKLIAVSGSLLVISGGTSEAGWPFSKKCCDTGVVACTAPELPKAKKSIFSAEEPPRAAIIDTIGAQFTNIRADRAPAPAVSPTPPLPAPAATPAIPPAPAACTPGGAAVTDPRVDQLATEVHNLQLQVQALTEILKRK